MSGQRGEHMEADWGDKLLGSQITRSWYYSQVPGVSTCQSVALRKQGWLRVCNCIVLKIKHVSKRQSQQFQGTHRLFFAI